MESENHFQTQTKANRYGISKAMFVLQIISKVFAMHYPNKRGIQKNAYHVTMVNITNNLKRKEMSKVSKTDTPRKSGAIATLKVGCFF